MSGPKSSSFFGSNESSNGCVMVVEEDPTIRNSVRQMLEKGGYDVLEVEGGEKAIETIGQGENPLVIDVIITDIDKAKGMEAITYFNKQHPRVSLIALTGMEDSALSNLEQTKIVILGAGKGGTAFLELLSHLPDIEIVGITDKNPSAPGLTRARELGVSVWDDIVSLIAHDGVDLIVDVTANPEMARLIGKHKSEQAEVLGGAAAKLFWNVAQYEARMQAQVLQTENVSNMVKGGMIVDYLVQPVEETKINAVVTKAMAQREIARL
jgi:CheY-like chemotaxis protein